MVYLGSTFRLVATIPMVSERSARMQRRSRSVGDLVGQVDGQGRPAAPSRDPGDGDDLLVAGRVDDLRGEAIHRRLEILGVQRQRDDLPGPGPHGAQDHLGEVRLRAAGVDQRQDRPAGEGRDEPLQVLDLPRRLQVEDQEPLVPLRRAQGRDDAPDVGGLGLDVGRLIGQLATDVREQVVVAADHDHFEGIHEFVPRKGWASRPCGILASPLIEPAPGRTAPARA